MDLLSREGRKYLEELRDDNFEKLEKEFDITSTLDYLEFSGGMDLAEDSDSIRRYLQENDASLDIFFHNTPLLDQDIMYASLNPKIAGVNCSKFESGTWLGRQISDGDVEELAWQTVLAFNSYLVNTPGPRKIITKMRDNLETLPDSETISHEEYVVVQNRNDIKSSYYNDVYHTRFSKLPSKDKGFLKEIGLNYCREHFAEEIETVNPKLIVAGCKDAWMAIQDHLVSDTESDIIPHRDSIVTSNYSNQSNKSAVPGLFQIPSKELWVITTFQESRPQFIKFDEFESNLSYVRRETNL